MKLSATSIKEHLQKWALGTMSRPVGNQIARYALKDNGPSNKENDKNRSQQRRSKSWFTKGVRRTSLLGRIHTVKGN